MGKGGKLGGLTVRYPREYDAFKHARRRCTNPNDSKWKDYGGRGIQFLFTSFENFLTEIGSKPDGLTLERSNNEGHYEPGNVCWATPRQQVLNRRPERRRPRSERVQEELTELLVAYARQAVR